MSYDKTRLFSAYADGLKPIEYPLEGEVFKKVNEEENKFEEQPKVKEEHKVEEREEVMEADFEEVDEDSKNIEFTPERVLKFNRIGKKIAQLAPNYLGDAGFLKKASKTVGVELETYEDLFREVAQIVIQEFTGNFDELLEFVNFFYNVKEVYINSMVSVKEISSTYCVRENILNNCTIHINECSGLPVTKRSSVPRIKITHSLVQEPGVYGNIYITGGLEDWHEEIMDKGETSNQLQVIDFKTYHRFNRVYLFNKIFGTRLRSIGDVKLSIAVNPEEGFSKTKFGWMFERLGDYFMSYDLEDGSYKFEGRQIFPNIKES